MASSKPVTYPTMNAREFLERSREFDGCELHDGKVVPMGPVRRRHGRAASRIVALLTDYIERRGCGEVVVGDVGYQLTDDLVLAPDIALHLEAPEEKEGWETEMPDLVVEVASPSDTWAAVERKVQRYFAAGVREVWLVDPWEPSFSIRRPGALPAWLEPGGVLETPLLPGFSASFERLMGQARPVTS